MEHSGTGGEKDMENVIGPLLAFAGSLIPIMGLVWKMSAVVSRVKQNTVDINNIGEKLQKTERDIEKRFDELSERLNKIEISIGKIDTSLLFIKEEIRRKE
jgi:hypothetical protein